MENKIKELLEAEGIYLFGACPLSECTVTKKYLLEKNGISDGSVILFAIPYFTRSSADESRNISAYAVCRDYHAYTKELEERLSKKLNEAFPNNRFAFFSDHSPIDERDAATKCKIGFFGKNRLLITERYSSYIFLAEIVTDAILSIDGGETRSSCIGCSKCISACPMNCDGAAECLSAITQKKNALSEEEIALMQKHKTFWGCDVCQEVCPHTKKAIESGSIFSKIAYFSDNAIPHLTKELVENMSDDEFSKRAYSWRGRSVILRNLDHLNE